MLENDWRWQFNCNVQGYLRVTQVTSSISSILSTVNYYYSLWLHLHYHYHSLETITFIIFILVVDATFSVPVSCYHYYSVSYTSLVLSFFFIIKIVIVILLYHCYYYPWHQLDSWAIVESESCEFTESIFSLLTRGSTFLLRNLW